MTTDSMVEKMARAIETAMPDYLAREIENRGLYAEIARAALEAMRVGAAQCSSTFRDAVALAATQGEIRQ